MNERLKLANDSNGNHAQFGYLATDAVTLDGTSASAATAAYTAGAKVRLSSVGFADCWVEIGTNPTAVAESAGAILVNGTEYTIVEAGDKIAVIGGKLNVVSALK
jgi:hypothetical protein